jgi:hypothetical protein
MTGILSSILQCLTAFAFLAASMADNARAMPSGYQAPISMPSGATGFGGSQPPVCRISDTAPIAAARAVTVTNTTDGEITIVGISDNQSMEALAAIGAGETLRIMAPGGVSAFGFLQDNAWVGDGYRITGASDQSISVPFADPAKASGDATDAQPADPAQKAMEDYQRGQGSVPVRFTNTTGDPVMVVATDDNNNGFPLYSVEAGQAITQRAQPGTKLWFYKAGTNEIVGAPYVVEISDGEAVSIPLTQPEAAALSPMRQKQSGAGSIGARFTNATDFDVTVIVADEQNNGHVLFDVKRGASLDARVLPGAHLFFNKAGTEEEAAPAYEVAGLDGEEITISQQKRAQQQQVEQDEPQKSEMQILQEGPGSIPVRFTNSLQETATVFVFSEGEVHTLFEIGAGETVVRRVLPQTDLRFVNSATMTDIGEPYVTKGVKGEKVSIVPPKPRVDPAIAAIRDRQSGPGSVDVEFRNAFDGDVAVAIKDAENEAIPLFIIPAGQILQQKALPGSELWFYQQQTGDALWPSYEVTSEQSQSTLIRRRLTLEQMRQQHSGPGSVSITFRNSADFAIEGIIDDRDVQMPARWFQVAPGGLTVQQFLPTTTIRFKKAGTGEPVGDIYHAPASAPETEVTLPYAALNELAAAEAGPGSVPVAFINRSGEIVAIAKSIGKGEEKKLHTLYKIDPGQSVTHRLQPKTQIWFVKGDTDQPVGRDIPYFVRAIPGEAVQLPYNPTDDELLAINGINIDKMIVDLAGEYSQKTPEGPQFCWRDSYGRGVGTIPRSCPPGMSEDTAGLCYPNCKPGYKQFVTMCIRECPPGYTDDGGLYCYKPAPYERNAFRWKFGDGLNMKDALARCKASSAGRRDGCGIYNSNTMVYTNCRAGYETAPVLTNLCSPKCPSDMVNFGVSCLKPTYDRGVGQLMSCSSGMQRDAGLCYQGCRSGFAGVGPVCWNQCPASLPYSCGMGCAADKKTCDSAIVDQVTSPLIAAGSIALTVVTAGGGSAAANAAKTAGKTSAQIAAKAAARESARQSLKASVKSALTRMAKVPIAKEIAIDTAIGSTIGVMIYGYSGISADFGYLKLRDAIKQIVISRMLAKVDDEQIDAVVNTVMEGAEVKAGVNVDFPWTSLDPSGIADIVIAYNYPVCTDVKQ